MSLPTIVTFTGMAPSAGLYAATVEHTQLLGDFADEIRYCEVTYRANLKHCRDSQRFLVQVHVVLANSRTHNEYGIVPQANIRQAPLVLRRVLLALAQRIDDRAPYRRRGAALFMPSFPVP